MMSAWLAVKGIFTDSTATTTGDRVMAASNSFRPVGVSLFILLLVILIAPAMAYVPDTLTVTVIDVGESDAIMVQAPNGHAMLIDAGRKGDAVTVSDALATEGITRLDYVVGTHEDADHIGGMVSVLSYMTVGEYVNNGVEGSDPSQTTLFLRTYLASRSIIPRAVTAGDTLALDPTNVTVSVLNPQADRGSDDNSASVVLRLTFGTQSFLLAADADERAEERMIASGQQLTAQVLKVGHHGSKSATTPAFIAAVDPSLAVISVGPNSYGHPDPAVIARLEASGATVYRTDTSGTIRIMAARTGYGVDAATGPDLPLTVPLPVWTTPIPTWIQPIASMQPIVTVPAVTMMPVPVAPAVTIAQPRATFIAGKRYAVGNPGAYLGTHYSVGGRITVTDPKIRIGPVETYKPGSWAYGITPPTGQFVRWYPAARWGAGIK